MAVHSMSMRAEQQSSFHLCIKHVTHREVTHTRRNAIKKLRPRGSVARRQPLGDSEFAWVFHGRCCFTLSSRTGSSIKRLPGQRDRRLRRHSSKSSLCHAVSKDSTLLSGKYETYDATLDYRLQSFSSERG